MAARDSDPDHYPAVCFPRRLTRTQQVVRAGVDSPPLPPQAASPEAGLREGAVDTDDQNFVEYSCADRIATITLNRPDKLNAVSDEVVRQLDEALHRFDLDPEADVAILNGRGRAFCSGADVRQRQLRSRDEFEKLGGPQGWGTNSADLLTHAVNWKPIITAVHGYVLGL